MSLLLAVVCGTGLLGLGSWLGGSTLGDRWVRGWTATWWLVVLTGVVVGPRSAAAAGLTVLTAGALIAVPRLTRERRTLALSLSALLLGAPLWLAPPVFYDALVYHLGLPASWLANSSIEPVPHVLFSRFPLAASTLFLVPVAVGLPEAAAALHWLTGVVAAVSLAQLARRLGGEGRAWIAPLLLAGCWHALWLMSLAVAEGLVVLAVVVALERLAATEVPPRQRAVAAGLALGLGLASKYVAAVPVAAVLVAALASGPRLVVGTGVVAVASSSFWWLRNLVQVGNPVFPLAWSQLGGRGWTARDQTRWAALVHERSADLVDALARLVVPPAGLGWWLVATVPLAIVAVATKHQAARRARTAGVAAAAMLVLWLVTSQTSRYGLPLAAVLAALAAAGMARLGRRSAMVVATALAVLVGHGLVSLGLFLFGALHVEHWWLGKLDREEWRREVTVNDPLPAFRACNELVPTDGRVLVVGEGRPFGLQRRHHVSSPYDLQLAQEVVERAGSAEEVAVRLAADGFTHVLLNWGELRRLGGSGFQVLRWESVEDARRWRDFLARYTTQLWRQGDLDLRALVVVAAPGRDGRASSRVWVKTMSDRTNQRHGRQIGPPGSVGDVQACRNAGAHRK